MTLDEIEQAGINPALALLPDKMDTPQARVMLFAIGLQESGFVYRRQKGNGPAKSFWQAEQGGGFSGVLVHPATTKLANHVCKERKVQPNPKAVWNAIEYDDVLASAFARLLLYSDPLSLPDDADDAWRYYLRTWRPGKPRHDTWNGFYSRAHNHVQGAL